MGIGAAMAAVVSVLAYYVMVPVPVQEPEPAVAAVTPAAEPALVAAPNPEVPNPEVPNPEVPNPEVPVQSAPAAEDTGAAPQSVAEPAVAGEGGAPAVAEAAPIAPSLDVVRVEPDGTATVAGHAGPGEAVTFKVEGVEVFSTTTDANGNFVGLLTLPPSTEPQLLSIEVTAPDGDTQSVEAAVSAIAGPVVQAETATEVAVAPEVPAVLLISPEGVKVVPAASEPAAAPVAANVSLDSIAYAPDGAVLLSGRGTEASTVRIYLNDAAVADAVVGRDGIWTTGLGAVAAGIYTLRVDQLSPDGRVSSRFETPFKRETAEALAAAVAAPVVAQVAPDAAALAAPEAAPEVSVGAATTAPSAAAALSEPAVAPDAVPKTAISITVQPGFTLWGIAKKEFGNGVMYVQVFDANKDRIKDPDLIYPGQVFLIPGSP